MKLYPPPPDIVDLLAEHRTIGEAPRAELEWLAAHGMMRSMEAGERVFPKGADIGSLGMGLEIVLVGRIAIHVDRGAGLRRVMEWQGGVEVDPDLPEVHAIGGELNQVWMNLIDNALDAVDQGGQVVVTARAEGRWVIIRVIDDGPGIPPGNKPRVFDPFFTTKGPGEGTGLGLEVARNRVRGHGGDIDFDSRPGRTEFRVFLPLRQDAETPADQPGNPLSDPPASE